MEFVEFVVGRSACSFVESGAEGKEVGVEGEGGEVGADDSDVHGGGGGVGGVVGGHSGLYGGIVCGREDGWSKDRGVSGLQCHTYSWGLKRSKKDIAT